MRIISTKLHGVLDYLTVATLLALPPLLNWETSLQRLLIGAAIFVLLYSLVTRYELSLAKVLPMTGHLGLDVLSGLLLLAAPFLLGTAADIARPVLMGIGLFELLVALLTQIDSPVEERLSP